MQSLREDLVSALRQIRHRKGIAAAVVLMIGVGIGANTAIFGLFKATFDEPPFPNMNRLVLIRTSPPGESESSPLASIPEYLALEEQNQSFDAIGQESLERYEAALKTLREVDREAIIARVELQQSYDEIAIALGKPSADAARMAVVRALKNLLKAMSTKAGSPDNSDTR